MNTASTVASLLPHSIGPYLALMVAGFVIAAYGHLIRVRWMIAIGVIMIFLATVVFPLVINATSETPEQPGPVNFTP